VLYPAGIQGRAGIPEQSEFVVFQNTTIWTCGPEGLLKDADLIIHKGIIQKIGMDLEVPSGALVIDGSKLQLSPGLIDCHSHMATDSGVNEAAQAVTAEVRIGDFVDASDITIYRQLAGGLTAANILHGSANPIGGQNQVIKLRWGGTYDDLKFADAPAGIKFALGENVKQSNAPEGSRSRYPQSRMGVEQLIRDRFNSARAYDAAWKKWNKDRIGLPPRRDLELDALAEILRGERWIHCHSYRQDEILGLLRVLEDYNIKIGSLQHILEGYKVAEAIAKHGATASSFSDWWNYKFEVLDAIPYNGAIMHKQGIVVSFNSDDAELGRHMNHEAAKAIKYGGVEPMEALKFVTLNPAKQLRIDNMVGSIEVGKHADISVWSGSPLSTLSRCEQTWIDGRKYFDRQWDAECRKRDFTLHQALVQKILESGESAGERSPLADDPSRLWPHHDEYCHHHHDEADDLYSDHDHDSHQHSDHEHEQMGLNEMQSQEQE
jgi:N-acetylglucosamine-6-phosphate deacetylase